MVIQRANAIHFHYDSRECITSEACDFEQLRNRSEVSVEQPLELVSPLEPTDMDCEKCHHPRREPSSQSFQFVKGDREDMSTQYSFCPSWSLEEVPSFPLKSHLTNQESNC